MLGETYKPSGLALETAQVVLEVKEPRACNVALGCSNGCPHCFGPLCMRMSREDWMRMRFPKKSPRALVVNQFNNGKLEFKPEGVFLSFFTDVFLPRNRENTEDLIDLLLNEWKCRVATLSKVGTSDFCLVRHGMTVSSLDEGFWKLHEPNAPNPRARVEELEAKSDLYYTWVSMEPYPCSEIWKQDIHELLEALKFVDLIVFGKWNYDSRASTEQARKEYHDNILVLTDFCKSNNIRCHVKSDTLRFCGLEE